MNKVLTVSIFYEKIKMNLMVGKYKSKGEILNESLFRNAGKGK